MPGAPKPVGNFGLIPALWQQLGQTINTLQGQTKALNQGARQTNLVDGNGNTQVINGNLAQTVTIGASFGQAGVQVGTALTNTAGIALQQALATTTISTTVSSTSATVASATGLSVGMVIGAAAPSTTVASGSNGGTIANIASWSNPSAGVLDVASTDGFAPSGTLIVSTSTGTAEVTYAGISGTSFTGCAYVSGSGTVATGGNVSSPESAITPGTTISAISGTTVTLSQNAAATGSALYCAACNWVDLASGETAWIIVGAGPPTAPPPGGGVGILYIDITNGGLYQYADDGSGPSGIGWVQTGGYSTTLPYPGVSVDPSTTDPVVTINGVTAEVIVFGTSGSPGVAVRVNSQYWVFQPDGGVNFPAADSAGFAASTLYSSVSPPTGAFGVAGDWCICQNGTLYFNNAGTWAPYAGSGSGGWQTGTVSSVTYGSPSTIDISGGPTGVPTLSQYTPYVSDEALIAEGTTYGTSGLIAIGSITSAGGATLPPGSHTLTVPPGITAIQVRLYGSQGTGTYGGLGSYVIGTYPVTAGATIYINCGLQGGGTNGGGAAADLRVGGSALADRVLIAAGGGTEGVNATTSFGGGGAGGGFPTGSDPQAGTIGGTGGGGPGGGGAATASSGGAGGTSAFGNGTAGTLGDGGSGGGSIPGVAGGGGGDGLYGGGGGAGCAGFGASTIAGGGGGGTDYADSLATGVTSNAGYQSGDGSAIFVWLP